MPRQPHTVKRTELKYHVYQDLKEKLIHCTYPPGSMLNEVQLASQYGLSRTPIREAINRLEMDGYVKVIPKKGQEQYLYDDKELERYRKTHTGEFSLQRYKGLGEMDPEQLWETTLDPERRVLKQVEIEDARMASEITEMLMGSDVPPRRQFIYDHADEAEIDA